MYDENFEYCFVCHYFTKMMGISTNMVVNLPGNCTHIKNKLLYKFVKTSSTPIFKHFANDENICNLIRLYGVSQMECCRNGRLTPEIGTSREKDLIASFVSNPELSVVYDIPNAFEEDVIVNEDKISIKHSSNRRVKSNGIKAIWTSNEVKQCEFVAEHAWSRNLLLSYVRFEDNRIDKGELELLFIDKDIILHQQYLYLLKEKSVFKCLKGNSRGIEFTSEFFEQIINNCEFRIVVKFELYNEDEVMNDPIQRRVKSIITN